MRTPSIKLVCFTKRSLTTTTTTTERARNRAKSSPFHEIPGPKPLPIIGNIWRYLPLIGDYRIDTLFENAKYNKKRYGPIVREQITKKHTILHLFDPKDVGNFIRHDGKYPFRRSHRALLKYRLDRPELYRDGGLFPENGPNWYRQRNQFQQRLMAKSQVLSNSCKVDRVSLRIINAMICNEGKLESSTTNDESNIVVIENFESILYRWALATSLTLFLDTDIDRLEENYVQKFIQELHNSLTSTAATEIETDRWIKQPNKCPHYKTLAGSQEFLHDFVSAKVNNYLGGNGVESCNNPSYLHDWLIVDKIDRKDIVSFIIDALMAGLHTTTYTIAFLLYHLSNNIALQTSLRKEINSQLPRNESIAINQIDELTSLRNCLKETMRLNPVSIGTGRVCSQDNLTIRGFQIPEGCMIITQNQAISRDETIFAEANKFKPERWTTYRECPREFKPSPFASLPFGFGARSCIGKRLAELQIKIMAARLLQRFEIRFNGEIPTRTTLIHNIGGSIRVNLRKIPQDFRETTSSENQLAG